jgi:hypothetical protein
MSVKLPTPPSDSGAAPAPKRVQDLPTFQFTKSKARTRGQARQAASKDALFGVTSLGDVLRAAQGFFTGKKG